MIIKHNHQHFSATNSTFQWILLYQKKPKLYNCLRTKTGHFVHRRFPGVVWLAGTFQPKFGEGLGTGCGLDQLNEVEFFLENSAARNFCGPRIFPYQKKHMDLSENRGWNTPNHPFYIGFSIIFTIHFGVFPYFWKHPYHFHYHIVFFKHNTIKMDGWFDLAGGWTTHRTSRLIVFICIYDHLWSNWRGQGIIHSMHRLIA